MKLLFKDIDKKGKGTVRLIAEEAEDMWHAYNLISIGDYLRSTTIRRVINETAGGLTSTQRVHTTLTICVKSLDFDTQAGVLRVKGINSEVTISVLFLNPHLQSETLRFIRNKNGIESFFETSIFQAWGSRKIFVRIKLYDLSIIRNYPMKM